MSWLISRELLGTHSPGEQFSYTIGFVPQLYPPFVPPAYLEDIPWLYPPFVPPMYPRTFYEHGYDIDIIQLNSNSTDISTDNSVISGKYSSPFTDTMTILNTSNLVVTKTDNIFDASDVKEIISFVPDVNRSKDFYFRAYAKHPITKTIISIKNYTIKIEDKNWNEGKNNFINFFNEVYSASSN